MPVTTLAFLRKRQVIPDLDKERPQSHAKLRATILRATNAVDSELNQVQLSYYNNSTPEKAIEKWTAAIKYCLDLVCQFDIKSTSQLDFLLHKLNINDWSEEDLKQVRVVKDFVYKLENSIPVVLKPAGKALKNIQIILQKYCLSFYPKDIDDSLLETAKKYEETRQEYYEIIEASLNQSLKIKDQFDSGFSMTSLSSESQNIGRKLGCEKLPFVLLFAESMNLLKECCVKIRNWVQEDSNYLVYIKDDVDTVEESQETQRRILRDLKDQIYQSRYRYDKVKRQQLMMSSEIVKLQPKVRNLQNREIHAINKFDKIRLNLEVVKIRKYEIKSQKTNLTRREKVEMQDVLFSEFQRTQTEFISAKRKVQHLERSLTFIDGKRDRCDDLVKSVKSFQQDIKSMQIEHKNAEIELERLNGCHLILRDIYRLKECSETLKKIFLHEPVKPGQILQAKGTMDLLGRACAVTSRHIGTDWVKLYHQLPFDPPRGNQQLANDIISIDAANVRGANEDQARQSLAKWRRLHTRAKFSELKMAIVSIRRYDVIDELEHLFIKRKEKEAESEYYNTKSNSFFLPSISS